MSSVRALVVATTVALLATGCSDPADDGGSRTPAADDAAWSTSTDPVAAGGLVWAGDGVVHLSDGTTVDVGQPMQTYVVAGDGVYFTSPDAETDEDLPDARPLLFADRDGTTTDTGVTVYEDSLGASPDGRHLGFVDATSGEEDDFSGLPQAIAVVLDLTSGERVVESTEVMGDPDEDDLAHDYDETSLLVRFPDEQSALVEGLGERLYSLPDGEGRDVDPSEPLVHDPLDDTNRSDTWTIDRRGDLDLLRAADGERVRPRTGTERWHLGPWFDDRTVLGVAVPGSGPSTLVTCVVPDGSCTEVEGTTGQVLQLPLGLAGADSIDLAEGSS